VGRWNIHPIEVRGVLAQTKGVAGEFDEHTTAMQSALDGAGAESSSELVASALSGFVAACRDDMRFMFQRVEAAVSGAGTAVNAYLQGDHEMVLNAQSQVAKAPEPRSTMPGGGYP
jgi:hypothetical protein